MKKNSRVHGFTLLELMFSLAIFTIILGYSSASLHDIYAKKRLESAAQKIYSDLRYAQSESIKLNAPVFISFTNGNKNWCYGINVNTPCDCNIAQSCKLGGREYVVKQSLFRNVSLIKSRFAGNKNYTAFDSNRGFAIGQGIKNGTVWLSSTTNDLIAVVISRMGRVRICSPSLAGYSRSCPKPPII